MDGRKVKIRIGGKHYDVLYWSNEINDGISRKMVYYIE